MEALISPSEVRQGFDYAVIDEGIRDEVRQAARSIHQLERGVMTGIVAIGKRLIEVKGMLEHGQFEAWVSGEFGLEMRMAQNYMNVARAYGDGQKRNIISLFSPTVAYMLSAPSYPEEARVEVEQAAASGQKVDVQFVKEAKAAVTFAQTGKLPARAEIKPLLDAPKPTPPVLAQVHYQEPVKSQLQPKYCIGFGEYDGRCLNYAGGKRQNPYWCDRCDELRCASITKQLESIADTVGVPVPWRPDPSDEELEAMAEVIQESDEEEAERYAIEGEQPPEPSLARVIALRDAVAHAHELAGQDKEFATWQLEIANILRPLNRLVELLEAEKSAQ